MKFPAPVAPVTDFKYYVSLLGNGGSASRWPLRWSGASPGTLQRPVVCYQGVGPDCSNNRGTVMDAHLQVALDSTDKPGFDLVGYLNEVHEYVPFTTPKPRNTSSTKLRAWEVKMAIDCGYALLYTPNPDLNEG